MTAQIVVTVAGQAEVPGDANGPAFEARFNNPHGIAIDDLGNVYTADRWSHLIRKITPEGMVSTIAGKSGISGDIDGDTSIALFNEPWGICVDQNGNVLVADTRNNKIRKINPEGIVSTIAGSGNFGSSDGIGSASSFGNPTGIECDKAGNIYVADHLTHIIRKIDPQGMVTTIAGTAYQMGAADGPGGIASFARPYGLSLDLEGNILVADEWNHKIRKIDSEGIVSTIAGNGIIGGADGEVGNASFNYPWDITVDSLGNIFVADGYNYVIRKITTDGMVQSFVGSLETTGANDGMGQNATFSGATAIAISPLTKEIFVGDAYNNLVRKIIDLNQGVSVLMSPNSTPTLCKGEPVEVYASPDIYSSYFFYVDDQIVQSGSNPNFNTSALDPGTHQIKVVIQDNGNTFQSSPKTITVLSLPEPSISIVGETSFYEGDSVVLVASQGTSYFWSTGETTPTISVKESGSYKVEVSDQNNCYGETDLIDIQVLEIPSAPIITLNGSSTLCSGTSIELVSNYQNENQWLKDGWPINEATDNLLKVRASGTYQVQVTLSSGIVVLSDPIDIEESPALELDFSASNTDISAGTVVDFQINQSNLTDIEWNFGMPNAPNNSSTLSNPSYTYTENGSFSVTLSASNSDGCRDTLIKENYITVNDSSNPIETNPINNPSLKNDLFIPTAFTPNDDGENDVLYVRGSEIVSMTFNVYNKWGAMIFESKSQQIGWDGTHLGQGVQNGNYVYCLNITKTDGSTQQMSGHVTIIR